MPKLMAPLAKRVVYGIIVAAAVLVAVNIAVSLYFQPDRVVSREIDLLAREYYENYYYQNLVGERTGEEKEKLLSRYAASGTAPTYLRQILLYDGGKHKDLEGFFVNDTYTCDLNKTAVVFFPEAPYGPENYHFETRLSCE